MLNCPFLGTVSVAAEMHAGWNDQDPCSTQTTLQPSAVSLSHCHTARTQAIRPNNSAHIENEKKERMFLFLKNIFKIFEGKT